MNIDPHRARLVPVFCGLLFLAGAVALKLGVQSSRAAGPPGLYASFNADGSMKMSLDDGTPVGTFSPPGTVIPPGTYLVVAHNSTADDNYGAVNRFHLFGPGVDDLWVLTQEEEAQATWTVTFQPNSTYTFQDDSRPNLIHVVFRTSGSGTPSSGSSSSGSGGGSSGGTSGSSSTGKFSNSDIVGSSIKSLPFRGVLTGTVSPAGKLTLTRNGKGVSGLKSGRYRITVTDKTSKSGFTVQQIRKQPVALTGAAFVGKHTTLHDLKVGQWMFYSSPAHKNYFIVVA